MSPSVSIIFGSIAAIVITVLLYIKVLPRKYDGKLPNKYWQFAHDFFHFKKLYLGEVLKAIYVLANAACIAVGAFMLISFETYTSYYYGYTRTTWYGGYGLLLMICGPIALRLTYEGIMMFILLVKNTIEINNKLKASEVESSAAPAEEIPANPTEEVAE